MGDILFLAHRIPYPPNRGDKIRSYNLLKKLCTLGTVHVATFADDADDLAHADALQPMTGSLHVELRNRSRIRGALSAIVTGKPISLTMFDSSAIRRFVASTLANRPIKTVFVFSGQMAQFVPPLSSETRFLMDFGDVDSAKFASYAQHGNPVMRFIHAREAKLLAAFENKIAQRADQNLFVTEAEADLFRSFTGLDKERVRALENGIDCDFFDPEADFRLVPESDGPRIVFTGQMDYRPNIEAVSSFATEALLQIRAHREDAQFVIVGRNPSSDVQALARLPGVTITGPVDDIRSWMKAADVIVAPLRIARGIQNKVLEAMAMAKPVVASQPAFEGIDATPGRDLLVAQTPQQEAELILDLLGDEAMAASLGRAARHRMLARYGWDRTLAPLAELIGVEDQSRTFADRVPA